MPRPHLPLSALRAFEAAFRQRGYSRAADELGLSHGAVSHHIKSLEQLLGVKLFRRDGHVMVPTEAGQRLALHVSEGMSRLAQGIEEVRARKLRSRIVTVSVLPAFAARWLIPRLASLHQSNPDIEVNIRASALLADLSHEGVDVGLRYGPGKWAYFKFRVAGLAGQVRASARRSEYLTRVEEVSWDRAGCGRMRQPALQDNVNR
nr:LysR family transcriptional regulator [Paraburkholderia sp. BL10I2N1]